MNIYNETKQTLLSEKAVEARSVKDRGLGLLQYDEPHAMIFHTRFGIHTFGMKYPIDVIVLSPTNHVVKLKKHLKPNSIFLWNPKYSTVVELPSGTIHETKSTLGDSIKLE